MAGKAPLLLAGVLYFIGMVGLTVTSVDEVPLRAFQQRTDVSARGEAQVRDTRPPREVPIFEDPVTELSTGAVDQPDESARLFAFASGTTPPAAVEPPASSPPVSAPPPAPPAVTVPKAPAPAPTETPNASAAAVEPPGESGGSAGGTTPLPPPGDTPPPPQGPPPAEPPPSDGGAVEPPDTKPGKSVGKAVANDRARERAADSSAVFSSTSAALKKAGTAQALPPGLTGKDK